jgi:hypothetical protein
MKPIAILLSLNILISCSPNNTDNKVEAESNDENFIPIPFIETPRNRTYQLDEIEFPSFLKWKYTKSLGPDFVQYTLINNREDTLYMYIGLHPNGPHFYKSFVYKNEIADKKIKTIVDNHQTYTIDTPEKEGIIFKNKENTNWIQLSKQTDKTAEALICKSDDPGDLKIHISTKLTNKFRKRELLYFIKSIKWRAIEN